MRARSVANMLVWGTAVLAVVALVVNVALATRARARGFARGTYDFCAGVDGTLRINTIHPPIRPIVARVFFNLQEYASASGREYWESLDWSIDIQPVSMPLTPLQRKQIIEELFAASTRSPLNGATPPQALAVVPPPGSTVITGSERVVHRWGFIKGVVGGWPAVLAFLTAIGGLAVWTTPKRTDDLVCGKCGYSREGLGLRAPCPECGHTQA